MYYNSESGGLDFIDTRNQQQAIILDKKTLDTNTIHRGRILLIDKETDKRCIQQTQFLKHTLKSFGLEVEVALSLQEIIKFSTEKSFDYYIVDPFKYLDTSDQPLNLISECISTNNKIKLVVWTSPDKALTFQTPQKMRYVARWGKNQSLETTMIEIAKLMNLKVQRKTEVKELNRISKPITLDHQTRRELSL